jgi:hypothetical protein
MVKTKGRYRKKRTKTRKRRGGEKNISAKTLEIFFNDNKIVQNIIKGKFPKENMSKFFKELKDTDVQTILNRGNVQKIYQKISKCFSMIGGSKKKMKGGNAGVLFLLILLLLIYRGIQGLFEFETTMRYQPN